MVDPKGCELAQYFLADNGAATGRTPTDGIWAQAIQDAVEDFPMPKEEWQERF